MARKYKLYEIATETGEEVTSNYRTAFAIYNQYKGSATLYGVDYMGDFSVILSK